jgi:hypothetical protein
MAKLPRFKTLLPEYRDSRVIAGIDPSAWSDVEKADFAASLTDLKKTILALLKK